MFHRTPGLVHVCLRCQRRLTRETSSLRTSSPLLTTSPASRWQSTSAAPDEGDDTEDNLHAEIHQPHDYAYRQRYTYEHFRPGNALEGVQALGRPAEVIVLPSRDRKPKPVPDEDGGGKLGSIQKLINAKSKFADPEEVRNAIEKIRLRLEKTEDDESGTALSKFKQQLAEAFTFPQLLTYMKDLAAQMEEPQQDSVFERMAKTDLIASITSRLWGLGMGQTNAQLASSKIQKSTLTVDPRVLQLVMLDTKQPLQRFPTESKVELMIFETHGRIEITGGPRETTAAKAKLRRLFAKIVTSTVVLDPDVNGVLADAKNRQTMLQMMVQNNDAVINFERGTLQVLSPSSAKPNEVLRALTLLLERHLPSRPWSVVQQEGSQGLVSVPDYSVEVDSEASNVHPWQRFMSRGRQTANGGNGRLRSAQSKLTEDAEAIWTNLQQSRPIFELYDHDKGIVRIDYTASIGRLLYKGADMSALRVTDVENLPQSKAFFDSTFSRLSQFLSRHQVISEPPPSSNGKKNKQDAHPALVFNLRLRPVMRSAGLPTFVISLEGRYSRHGIRQALRIRSVSAILQEQTRDILLPDEISDIRLVKRQKLDIFSSAIPKPSEYHVPILKQLARYLEAGQASASSGLDPVMSLDLSKLLHNPAAPEGHLQHAGLRDAQYIPEDLEVVETTTHKASIGSNTDCFIQHIIRDDARSPNERQQSQLPSTVQPESLLVIEKPALTYFEIDPVKTPSKTKTPEVLAEMEQITNTTSQDQSQQLTTSLPDTKDTPKRLEKLLLNAYAVVRGLSRETKSSSSTSTFFKSLR